MEHRILTYGAAAFVGSAYLSEREGNTIKHESDNPTPGAVLALRAGAVVGYPTPSSSQRRF